MMVSCQYLWWPLLSLELYSIITLRSHRTACCSLRWLKHLMIHIIDSFTFCAIKFRRPLLLLFLDVPHMISFFYSFHCATKFKRPLFLFPLAVLHMISFFYSFHCAT
ncbi:hypothetical protein HD554DRAFT_1193895 [Boletus coccyginus]|nr:hypothetical protein HD554DRAFT_1193895 [Boletus coccyginus]